MSRRTQGLDAAGVRRPDRRGAGARSPAGSTRRPTSSYGRRDEGHKRFVQEFLQRIYDNGDIYEGTYSGLYCVGCEAFNTEAEAVDGNCPRARRSRPSGSRRATASSASPPTRSGCSSSTRSGRSSCCPASGRTRRGASSSGACRTSASAAAASPGASRCRGTGAGRLRLGRRAHQLPERADYARPGEDLRETFWPAVRHMLGKDILRFHCVIWPALLLSAGYEVPQQLFVHGYLLLDDRKISKTLGNVIDPLELIDLYGADADPLLVRAGRLVRPGRERLDRRRARALRARARERAREPALAHDRDDRALPRGPPRPRLVGRAGGLDELAARSRSESTGSTSPARPRPCGSSSAA